MIVYSHTYLVTQEIERVFNYFLKKEYLTRFMKPEAAKRVEIISKHINESSLNKSDVIKVKFNSPEQTILIIDKIRVEKNSIIETRMTISTESSINTEDAQYDLSLDYRVTFEELGSQIKIIEQSKIDNLSLFEKALWKASGLYYKIMQRKIHQEVKRELEAL